MGIFEKLFAKNIESAEPKAPNFDIYFGRQMPKEKQQETLKEIKENPDKFEKGEYEGVKLLLAGTDDIPDGRKEYYFVEAEKEEIAGYGTIEIYPEEKRILLEAIEVFEGTQPEELSEGDFRRQGIGKRSILAVVDMLNKSGMEGWEISAVATNRQFNEKIFKALFKAVEEAGGWDIFRGKVYSLKESVEVLQKNKNNTKEPRGTHRE